MNKADGDLQSAGSGAVASLLGSLRAGLANGSSALRSTALRPLQARSLRAGMLKNPRLTERINQRLASRKGWSLPDQIVSFPEAENVIHLLTRGPENCFADIGLAWHGNTLSRIVMRGGGALMGGMDPQRLRRALSLRHPEAPQAAADLPPEEHLLRDGALCLMAWAGQLPANIAPTVTAVVAKDPTLLEADPIDPKGGNVAASIAAAWLAADRGDQQ